MVEIMKNIEPIVVYKIPKKTLIKLLKKINKDVFTISYNFETRKDVYFLKNMIEKKYSNKNDICVNIKNYYGIVKKENIEKTNLTCKDFKFVRGEIILTK